LVFVCLRQQSTKNFKDLRPKAKNQNHESPSASNCAKKSDEGREKRTANTLRGTLLLRMATLDTLAKQRRRHP